MQLAPSQGAACAAAPRPAALRRGARPCMKCPALLPAPRANRPPAPNVTAGRRRLLRCAGSPQLKSACCAPGAARQPTQPSAAAAGPSPCSAPPCSRHLLPARAQARLLVQPSGCTAKLRQSQPSVPACAADVPSTSSRPPQLNRATPPRHPPAASLPGRCPAPLPLAARRAAPSHPVR